MVEVKQLHHHCRSCTRFKKSLGVDCSHAAASSRSHSLSIFRVLHIASGKDTRDTGGSPAVRAQVSLLVHVKLTVEKCGIRPMADGHEHAGA